jgi:hypothetical protein
MRISHKHKFIFFSFPKTGSESLRKMLDPYSDITDVSFKEINEENPFYSHISPPEMELIFKEKGWDFDSYYKIVCIRNPFDRLVSLYEMIYRKWPIKPSFSSWIKKIKNNDEGAGGKNHERWRKYGSYCLKNYISDKDGKILVDKVIKLEEFETAIPELFSSLHIPIDEDFKVVKKNTGTRKNSLNKYYSSKSIEIVLENYLWELENFNYTFDK